MATASADFPPSIVGFSERQDSRMGGFAASALTRVFHLFTVALRSFERLVYIFRYHRAEQLVFRLLFRLRGWGENLVGYQPSGDSSLTWSTNPSPIPRGFCSNPTVPLEEFQAGRVTLLNYTIDLGTGWSWLSPAISKAPALWRFQLQYHEFLVGWIEQYGDKGKAVALGVISDWCEFNGLGPKARWPDAWHPYCISRRLPVWAWLVQHLPENEPIKKTLLQSFVRQAQHLSSHFEYDLGGNHLWENARALAIAGCVLDGRAATAWRNHGIATLMECVHQQLLPVGEHYERSPMYQADLARGLEELAGWLEWCADDRADFFRQVSRRMNRFLDAIRHPDGSPPLFGDTTLDHQQCRSVCLARLTADSERPPLTVSRWVGDYYVHAHQTHRLIVDLGDLGPDHLPAHAHADLLNFELSLYGRKFFVDSGTYCYAGHRRLEFRSSCAHNVLEIDGKPQADVWSSFRLGRRGHIGGIADGLLPQGRWVAGWHDAYSDAGKVARLWFFDHDGQFWAAVHLFWPSASSRNKQQLVERLHCHPDLVPQVTPWGAVIDTAGRPVHLELVDSTTAIQMESFDYSPYFYKTLASKRFVFTKLATGPTALGWGLSLTGWPARPELILDRERHHLKLRWWNRQVECQAVIPLRCLGLTR